MLMHMDGFKDTFKCFPELRLTVEQELNYQDDNGKSHFTYHLIQC